MNKIKTVFITGPTASGKTSAGIELAKRFNGEIISADSMQLYKGIHIASAAPDCEEKCGIKHHLLEFLELNEAYSVADYVKAAGECIKSINDRGKIPVVVGGTGLYISSLIDNITYSEEASDLHLRQELEELFDTIGAEEMLSRLKKIDPKSAQKLHPNDRRRIIRAFEVYRLTGKTITEQNILSKQQPSWIEPLVIGITYKDRELLYERINLRVDKMIESGLVNEARISHNNYSSSKGAFQAIGHKELYSYFNGEKTLAESIDILKRQTRRYAKRQLTWWSKENRINWFYPDINPNFHNDIISLTEKFLKGET